MLQPDPRLVEVWRPVTGFPNYEISSFGKLRVLDRYVRTSNGQTRFYKGGVLAPTKNQHGHLKVLLIRKPGVKEPRYLHQLVAQEFIGPRPDGYHVAHGDGDETNNRLGNLRYATPKENNADKILHGTNPEGEKHPSAKLTDADVAEVWRRLSLGHRQWEIAESFGVTRATIACIAQGRSWKCHGRTHGREVAS